MLRVEYFEIHGNHCQDIVDILDIVDRHNVDIVDRLRPDRNSGPVPVEFGPVLVRFR